VFDFSRSENDTLLGIDGVVTSFYLCIHNIIKRTRFLPSVFYFSQCPLTSLFSICHDPVMICSNSSSSWASHVFEIQFGNQAVKKLNKVDRWSFWQSVVNHAGASARALAQTDSCQSTSCIDGAFDRKDGPSVIHPMQKHLGVTCGAHLAPHVRPHVRPLRQQPNQRTSQLSQLTLTLPLFLLFIPLSLSTPSHTLKQGGARGRGRRKIGGCHHQLNAMELT
jgi:hypothetical protein